jgi:hypothetical protein
MSRSFFYIWVVGISCTLVTAKAGSQPLQATSVSVGAVTKYSGSASSKDRAGAEEFLATLESHLASAFTRRSELDYLDRSNLDEIFRETRVSSSSLFNAGSGALRGLLGRLDLLIVAEASSPASARVKVLDVETGAVKAAEICEPQTTIFGTPKNTVPSCVAAIANQTSAAAISRRAIKQHRASAAEAAQRAAEKKRSESIQQEKEETRRREQQARIVLQQQAEEQRIAEEQRAEQERIAQEEQARIEEGLQNLRPRLEDTLAQLGSESQFWTDLNAQMRAQGRSLRPEIQSALRGARAVATRCQERMNSKKPEELDSCLNELDQKLEQLNSFK